MAWEVFFLREGRAVFNAVSPPIGHSLVASVIKQARRHTQTLWFYFRNNSGQ
jgi:hypothetical protein